MEQIIQKSTIKKIKEPDWTKGVVITTLHADRQAVEWHYQQIKKVLGEKATEQQIWQRIDALVLKDNVFNEAMKMLVPCYEITIDPEDLARLAKIIRERDQQLATADDAIVNSIATRTITKKLIFDEIAKEWNIQVSDEEVNQMLAGYYKATNQPVRELMNNKEALEGIRMSILEQKIADAICKKLIWKADWDAIRASAQANAPKPEEPKTEEKK